MIADEWNRRINDMQTIDIIGYIIVIATILVLVLIIWALCVIAGKSDEISEECWREYIRSKEEEENEQ